MVAGTGVHEFQYNLPHILYFPQCFIHIHNTFPSPPPPCLTSPSLPPPCLTSPSLLPLCLTPSPPSPYLTFPIPWCPLLYWMINTIESLFILTTFTIVIHLQTFFTRYILTHLFTSMTLHFTLVAIGFTISSTHWSIYISTDKLTIACNINTSGRL